MNIYITYAIFFVVLLALELLYFRIAVKLNIVDKPNARSSHSRVAILGGGIIFLLGVWMWSAFFDFHYPWLLAAVTLVSAVSFVDDIRPLPDSVRLGVQFVAMLLLFVDLGIMQWPMWWVVLVAAFVCMGATNVINFMDGINGMTGGYSMVVLVPLLIVDKAEGFLEESFLITIVLAVLVFCLFNFRAKNKAKCFAGDVGSVGIASILLFAIGKLIVKTGDVTWLTFLLVYGVDGCLTIFHRILLHENLGEAHRKHAYQLMANELGMSHPAVSLIYMVVQLAVSLGFVYVCPLAASACGIGIGACHWIYLVVAFGILAGAYLLFMRKYYHLHEEYLAAKRENRQM